MCGNFFNPSSRSFLGNNIDGGLSNIAVGAGLTALGAPELAGLTGLGGAAATGLTGALVGGGLSGIEGQNPLIGAAAGGIGGYLGGGGLSDITNDIGLTANGVSDLVPDISGGLSNFADNTGLSQLFGGTAAPSSDLDSAYNAINTVAPNAAETAGATNPVDFAPGGASSSVAAGASAPGSAGVGGGTLTGFGGSPDTIGETSTLPSAQGGITPGTQDFLNNLPSTGGATDALSPSVIQASNAATPGGTDLGLNQQSGLASLVGSTSPIAQSGGNNMASGGLSSLVGSGSSVTPVNGLINAGLGYLLNNPNQTGANQISNATTAANANYQPFLQAGTAAENTLGNLYGNNGTAAQTTAMNNFQTTPGYQFALTQGENALNANNAATGQVLSGNAEEALNNYAQGTASQQYNNYINQLQNLASGGMSAAGGIGSNLLTGAGAQATASGNKAAAQNTAMGTGLNALFPTNNINLSQLLGGTGVGGNQGLLGMLNS